MSREVALRATEALAAELGVCVAFVRNHCVIQQTAVPVSPRTFDQSGPAYTMKIHEENPRPKTNVALNKYFHVFCEPEHPQKHANLR